MHPEPSPYDASLFTPMQQVGNAFAFLASLLRLNGRRLQAAEQLARTRVYTDNPNAARYVAMAPRAQRRKVWFERHRKADIPWRPVHGYVGPSPTLDKGKDAVLTHVEALTYLRTGRRPKPPAPVEE